MSDKEIALKSIEQLSDEVSFSDICEHVEMLCALKETEKEIESGNFVTQDAVEKEFAERVKQWKKK